MRIFLIIDTSNESSNILLISNIVRYFPVLIELEKNGASINYGGVTAIISTGTCFNVVRINLPLYPTWFSKLGHCSTLKIQNHEKRMGKEQAEQLKV